MTAPSLAKPPLPPPPLSATAAPGAAGGQAAEPAAGSPPLAADRLDRFLQFGFAPRRAADLPPTWRPDAILWDLDGTLAIWTSLQVVGHIAWAYLRRLAREEPWLRALLVTARAWRRMMRNPGPSTNDQCFNRLMAASLGRSPTAIAALTRELLAMPEVGAAVQRFLRPIPVARALVQAAHQSGRFQQAVATSPVMPAAFNRDRLASIGYAPAWFVHVTGSDLYSSQKDSPRFYQELLAHLRLPAERCLMVGNDQGKDLVAGAVGIPVFLLQTPFTRRRPAPAGLFPTWEGGYAELAQRLGLPATMT
ncbi:MAG: HAD-superfamily hydrolase, subfamily IA, variant 1 [Candidatus Ozemobacter sibiricus]|uniref:HAD-superfamily hydrolase, subfamily IA, variant 1 n=1 Tax=Candidatus Ozemobacter sibiricus TaxID=2268124 RepID=A0A367ZMV6_9BACT|nr:MAG: HAD-superfamily hydrolase, subfamily IA, variant 1 [Candidatus Ozemobacter sibiricus]